MINILNLKIISKKFAIFFIVVSILFGLFISSMGIQAKDSECDIKDKLSAGEVTKLVGVNFCTDAPADTCNLSKEINKGSKKIITIKDGVPQEGGILCVYSSFKNIVKLIKFGILIISVIVFSIAGVLYATARDDTKKRDQAKSYIFSGVVGLILTLVAHIIPSLVTWAF